MGTSGSTPLHFAAANGNTDVVTLLLLHGAHADRADKHGVTPEMLAQQNGWIECAKVLNDWILNKDQDLRDREGYDAPPGSSTGLHTHEQRHADTTCSRKRLHVKQSIDTALNMLKSTDLQSRTMQSSRTSTPPSSPHRPFGEYPFYPADPSASSPIDPTVRRPSLPHVLQPHSNEHIRGEKSFSSTQGLHQRRPRSAGTGSDQNPEQETIFPVYGRGGYGRKLGSKYSLLNIFKKAQPGETSGSHGNLPEAISARDSMSLGPTIVPPLSTTQGHSSQLSNIDLNENPNSVGSSSSASRPGFRFHRGSDASNKSARLIPQAQSLSSSPPPMSRKASGPLRTPPRSSIPLAFELQMTLAQQQQQRVRPTISGTPNEAPRTVLDADERGKPSSPLARFTPIHSGHNMITPVPSLNGTLDASPIQDNDAAVAPDTNLELESGKPSPSPRPGILRAHNRTSSSGLGSASNPRTLRFDSPNNDRRVRDKTIGSPMLKSHDSSGSLSKLRVQTNDVSEQEPRATLIDVGELDHEDNYGVPILPDMNVDSALEKTLNVPSVLLQRQRGQSFTSSSESSLSPILNATDPTANADFPFSINRPPSLMMEDHEGSSSPRGLLVPIPADTRHRGDSLSSGSTCDSHKPQLSFTSGSGTSPLIFTPGNGPVFFQDSDKIRSFVHDEVIETAQNHSNGLNGRRAHAPLDIDITSISSHAQAEALVERARQEALDFASDPDLSPLISSTGRSPLSARLAAYGESLALERKLREQKEQESSHTAGLVCSPPRVPDGVETQPSFEDKSGDETARNWPEAPPRPSTADGSTLKISKVS